MKRSLIPINEDDFTITTKMTKRLEKSRKQFKERKVTVCRSEIEINNH
ncbi:MAG: hypothetical protein LBE56_00895 [Tannerella sp.]|nr:hypothetical protein [Tannerella sp.]